MATSFGLRHKCDLCGQINYGKHMLSTNLFFCASCLQWHSKKISTLINNFSGMNLKGGEPAMAEIRFSNGDTEDWTKLELKEAIKGDFDKIIGFIKLTMPNKARTWDNKRNCWFIKTSYVDILITGLNIFIKGLNSNTTVLDKREKLESFDEFFNVPPPHSSAKPKTKEALIEALMELITKTCGSSITNYKHYHQYTFDDWKKIYRKAALAFHPDRNNGDGTKMGELNVIWNDLKEKL